MTYAQNLADSAQTLPAGIGGAGLMFRNRIINGNFETWQRGTSGFSTSVGTYTADRWRNDQIITVVRSTDVPNTDSRYSLDVTQGATSYGTITQRIESVNSFDLVGKRITLSFWVKNVSGSVGMNVIIRYPGAVDDFTSVTNVQTINAVPYIIPSSWTFYTFTTNVLPSQVANGLEIAIYRDYGSAQTRYSQIQLEVGSTATQFERRLYGLELALCQRYYQKQLNNGSRWLYTMYEESTYLYGTIPLQVYMRAGATSTLPAASAFDIWGVGAPSAITQDSSTPERVVVRFTKTGLTNYYAYILAGNGTTYFEFSAEL
jgi:hypothetical protein